MPANYVAVSPGSKRPLGLVLLRTNTDQFFSNSGILEKNRKYLRPRSVRESRRSARLSGVM